MIKTVMLCLSFVAGLSLGILPLEGAEHTHKQRPHKHEHYAREKNPVPMDEQSILKGKDQFDKYCIGCHGQGGKAGGSLDLTKAVFIHGDTDGEIFYVLTKGIKGSSMRSFEKELTTDMRWNLVNYIRSIRIKSSEPYRPGVHIR